MRKAIIIFTFILLGALLSAHPWKPRHYVIVDTDGGIDDMRAISMLLASPDVRVLGIIASSGVLDADKTYIKIKSLLRSFYHEGIPVGIIRNKQAHREKFPVAENFKWGDENGIDPGDAPGFLVIIQNIFRFEKTPVSYICLGGATSVTEASQKIENFRSHVKNIIWSCDGLKDAKGFNYNTDRSSSAKILSLDIPVTAVAGGGKTTYFDRQVLDVLEGVNTLYAMKIVEYSKSETNGNHSFFLTIYDELVPLFLHFPDLFSTTKSGDHSESVPVKTEDLKVGCFKILHRETVKMNQVINEFPVDPSFYHGDVGPSVKEITEKYGIEEWTSGVISNELHRHLGVFTVIGVKMGIRAREYFNTGVDEFMVTSFAGSTPPLSCMNDGIQVSTGATPGHGLLTVINDTPVKASCLFTYLGHKVRISLKPEISEKISGELKELNYINGLDSDLYWELVRKNAIRYWKDLDRHDIFIIEELKD